MYKKITCEVVPGTSENMRKKQEKKRKKKANYEKTKKYGDSRETTEKYTGKNKYARKLDSYPMHKINKEVLYDTI